MDIRVLEYFLAVAREKSISAAARSLHISQPALSTQLKALEKEVGSALFIRGAKGSKRVVLTEEGLLLRKRAEEIVELVRKTQRELSSEGRNIAGEVFIGTGESDTVRLFAKAAQKIRKDYPDITVHIRSGNAAFVTEQLEKGLIDIGMVYGFVDSGRYESFRLPGCDRWGVLMRRDSPLAEKESVRPEDLWDKPLILSAQSDSGRNIFSWLKKEPGQLDIVATYNLVFNASLLVDEGMGYAICFDGLINVSQSGLCFRPLAPALCSDGSVIWKRHGTLSKASGVFLEKLMEECGVKRI